MSGGEKRRCRRGDAGGKRFGDEANGRLGALVANRDDARPWGAGPAFDADGSVEELLDAVDDQRPGIAGGPDDALEAEEGIAIVRDDGAEER